MRETVHIRRFDSGKVWRWAGDVGFLWGAFARRSSPKPFAASGSLGTLFAAARRRFKNCQPKEVPTRRST